MAIVLLLALGCADRRPLVLTTDGPSDAAPADAAPDGPPPDARALRRCDASLAPELGRDGAPPDGSTGYACTVDECADRRGDNRCLDRDLEPNDCPAAADGWRSVFGSRVLPTFGHWIDFAICPPGDTDWFGFEAERGRRYAGLLAYDPAEGDLDAAFLDASGQVFATTPGALELTAPLTGRYYFVVFGADRTQTGRYELDVHPLCADRAPVCPGGYECQGGRCRVAPRPDAGQIP